MIVSVFGLGYVGTVTAACLAQDGHNVVGVDVNETKLKLFAEGYAPVTEPGVSEILRKAEANGQLSATMSVSEALALSDASLICVGTPSLPSGAIDLSHVFALSEELGIALRGKKKKHPVVFRSTMVPGTMDEQVMPRLSAGSDPSNLSVGYFPEFLREGTAIRDYRSPGAVVYSANDEASLSFLRQMNLGYEAQTFEVSMRIAEAIKYVNNAWHATKISFANEVGFILKSLEIDSHEVFRALVADTKLNVSPAYMTPGFAFGGSCLPKDVKALQYLAAKRDLKAPFLEGVLNANVNQVERVLELPLFEEPKRILLLGLSFKPDTDDLRYSPFVTIAERLVGRGHALAIYDPNVRPAAIHGANRAYLDTRQAHLSSLFVESLGDAMSTCDVVIIGNGKIARAEIEKFNRDDVMIVDLARVHELESRQKYWGICW